MVGIRQIIVTVLIAMVMVACSSGSLIEGDVVIGGQPTPSCRITAGRPVSVSFNGQYPTGSSFRWSVSGNAGDFEEADVRATQFTPYDFNEEKIVTFSLEIISGDTTKPLSINCTIEPDRGATTPEPSATATSEPPSPTVTAVTETPTPTATTETPTPTFVSVFDKILAGQTITVGVRVNSPPLSYRDNTAAQQGFEVDLGRDMVRRWTNSDNPETAGLLELVSADRFPRLRDSQIDILIAAATRTDERCQEFDCSLPYFEEGTRMLSVVGSGITGVCSLDPNRPVVVAANSVTSASLIAERRDSGCDTAITIQEVPDVGSSDVVQKLFSGEYQVALSDELILNALAESNPGLEVVGNEFGHGPYVVMVRKGDGGRSIALINWTLQKMQDDGSFGAIFCRYFGEQAAAFPIELLGGVPSPEIEALVNDDQPTSANSQCGDFIFPLKHTVTGDESLSEIAQFYYGKSSRVYWKAIYDLPQNRATIGPNPDIIKEGMELIIPPPPGS